MAKPWFRSKTKIGGVLLGASQILSGIGGYLQGDVDGWYALQQIAIGAGIIVALTGIRDALGEVFKE